MIPLPPVGDASQTSRLADELAMQIHLHDIAPGAPLREIELADAHGVSRTIVRAALQRLDAQGLAEITLNKGARVRHADARHAADLIELHATLTALAARRAADHATPQQIAHMSEFAHMLEHVADATGPDAAREFQHLRVGFARALFDAAGEALAGRLRAAAPVTPHHDRALDDVRDAEGRADAARFTHDLLAAIETGNADAAAKAGERLIRRHAERALRISPNKPSTQRRARTAA
jgi:DNA-binding GntR family transcriptional regulator